MRPSSVSADTMIIGAGPAGLGALAASRPDCLCAESLEEPGGVCGRWVVGGRYSFDFGGHFLHPNNRAFIDLATGALSDENAGLTLMQRNASVLINDTMVPYPLQFHVGWLPETYRLACVRSLITTPRCQRPSTLREALSSDFGDALVEIFFDPYIRKSVGWEPALLSPSQYMRGRIESTAREHLSDMWSSDSIYKPRRNPQVYYPSSGWFGHIFDRLAARYQHHIRYGTTVAATDLGRRVVHTQDGYNIKYNKLYSSAPLDITCRLVRDIAGVPVVREPSYSTTDIVLAALVFDGRSDTELQRLYLPGSHCLPHKLVLHHNDLPALRAQGLGLFLAEINASNIHEGQDMLLDVERLVRQLGLVEPRHRRLASGRRDVPRAYPVRLAGEDERYEDIAGRLRAAGVCPIGRLGEWRYLNSDDAFTLAHDEVRRNATI